MATFDDNIKTIGTAVYGKEMRPAISEALTQGWDAVKVMMGAVDQLNSRVDNLYGGGDSGGGSDIDGGIVITGSVAPSTLIIYGATTQTETVGISTSPTS